MQAIVHKFKSDFRVIQVSEIVAFIKINQP